MKKTFKIVFFVSLAVLVLSLSIITVSAINAANMHDSSVSIIGGADGPTAIFITSTLIFDNPVFVLAIVSFLLAAISAAVWISNRNK